MMETPQKCVALESLTASQNQTSFEAHDILYLLIIRHITLLVIFLTGVLRVTPSTETKVLHPSTPAKPESPSPEN